MDCGKEKGVGMSAAKESAAAQVTEAASRGSLETSLPPGPASAAPCAWKGLCPHAEDCDMAGTCLRAMRLDPDPTHWSREDRGDGYGETSMGLPLRKGE